MPSEQKWTDLVESAKRAILNRSYEEAESLSVASFIQAEREGASIDELISIKEQLAETQWYQSKLKEAADTCMTLMDLIAKGRDPISKVVCLSNLAIVHHTANNWQEAENYYLECLKEMRILLGPDHSYVTKYRSFYAELLNQQNREEEAQSLGVQPREVTEFDWQTSKVVSMIQDRLEKPTSIQIPETKDADFSIKLTESEFEQIFDSNSHRAEKALAEGNHQYAEQLWSLNLKLLEQVGSSEERLITALDNIAGIQYQQGNTRQAVGTFEKAVARKKKHLGKDDIAVARANHFLAGLHYELNDSDKATSLLKSSIKTYQKVYGREHATVASAYHNLATIYHVHHRYELAEKAYKDALEIKHKIYGPDHEETVRLTKSYAELLVKTGRGREAAQMPTETSGFITGTWRTDDED